MKEETSPWFKVFALCTALGLGGAFVWRQQQKAAPQNDEAVERLVLSGSKSGMIAPPPLPVNQDETNRVLMPSSKSGFLKMEPGTDKGRTMMSGSKSTTIELIPQDRILLPSSKSITMPIFREQHPSPAVQPKPVEP